MRCFDDLFMSTFVLKVRLHPHVRANQNWCSVYIMSTYVEPKHYKHTSLYVNKCIYLIFPAQSVGRWLCGTRLLDLVASYILWQVNTIIY